MIITKLIGGLGNQMFQYAIGRHLAYKNQTKKPEKNGMKKILFNFPGHGQDKLFNLDARDTCLNPYKEIVK